MNKVQNNLNLKQETDNNPISINKNLLTKEKSNSFDWLTDIVEVFLIRDIFMKVSLRGENNGNC